MDERELADLDAARGEFNGFLHVLRTQQLRRVPDVGGRFLSAGCSGRWYFDWIAENYAGTVTSHLGVEAFSPVPDDLPPEVVWLTDRLGDMRSVADGSVDVVFAGQVVEHLWADELHRFLAEAWRVLRPGGLFVLDSPNRPVTERLGWVQPEHTAEMSDAEIRELLDLAGFDDVEVTGVWSCRAAQGGRPLPLDPSDDPDDRTDWRARVLDAADHPDRAFVWWAHAVRGERPPAIAELRDEVTRVHALARSHAMARANTCGAVEERTDRRVVHTAADAPGHVLFGPYVPLPEGEHVAVFALERRHDHAALPASAEVAHVDVTTVLRPTPLRSRAVTLAELESVPVGGVLLVELAFSSDEMLFGFERRVLSTGAVALGVDLSRTQVLPAVVVRDLDEPITAAEPAPVPDGPVVAGPVDAPLERPMSVRADAAHLAASVRNSVAARARRRLGRTDDAAG